MFNTHKTRYLSLILSCALLTLPAISIASSTADSTGLTSITGKPATGKVVIDKTQCKNAPNIQAIIVGGTGGTGGWKGSNCPEGYMPYGLKSYVGMGLGNGQYAWHYYCCKSQIKYDV